MVNESMINFSDWRLLFVNKDGWEGALFCEGRKDAYVSPDCPQQQNAYSAGAHLPASPEIHDVSPSNLIICMNYCCCKQPGSTMLWAWGTEFG